MDPLKGIPMFSFMCDFFKKEKNNTQSNTQHGTQERPHINTIENIDPLYFIDIDDRNNIFARMIHVTSSANIDSIKSNGLLPLSNAKSKLLRYLESAYPNQNPINLFGIINKSSHVNAYLVTSRINEDATGTPFVAFLPLGETHYLSSAKDNGTTDSGEFFKAARSVIDKELRNQKGIIPYPDANPFVLITKHTLHIANQQQEEQIKIKDNPNGHDIIISCENKNEFDSDLEYYFSAPSPIHLTQTFPANEIQFMTYDDFINHKKKPISPAALTKLQQLFPALC